MSEEPGSKLLNTQNRSAAQRAVDEVGAAVKAVDTDHRSGRDGTSAAETVSLG